MSKPVDDRIGSLKQTGLHTANLPLSSDVERRGRAAVTPMPFLTISRQMGAGYAALPRRVAEALNARQAGGFGPDLPKWSAWDHELLEKVAADHHMPLRDIEALEQSGHSWLDSFIGGIGGLPDEVAVLHRMTQTVRELARRGRVILAGHGSTLMTRDLPGGLHFRLVAPLPRRVENVARCMNLSPRDAARKLADMERNRRAFIHRFWPGASGAPDRFTATFNTALLDERQIVSAVAEIARGSHS